MAAEYRSVDLMRDAIEVRGVQDQSSDHLVGVVIAP